MTDQRVVSSRVNYKYYAPSLGVIHTGEKTFDEWWTEEVLEQYRGVTVKPEPELVMKTTTEIWRTANE